MKHGTDIGINQASTISSVEIPTAPVGASDDALRAMVRAKVTCPFLGPAVAARQLLARNSLANPLAEVEDLRALGNSGGGDLGDLLALFAAGNHLVMRGAGGQLSERVPLGLFSLELPGSQGSHFGHSGILQGDPQSLDSGRVCQADFDRLRGRARNGAVTRSDVGGFIAENVRRDPNAHAFGLETSKLLLGDLASFVSAVGPAVLNRLDGDERSAAETHRDMEQKLTKLLGQDNLVGSAGEFGLMFAFFAHKPGMPALAEPALAVADLESMFLRMDLPPGWEQWRKLRIDWVRHTTAIVMSAGKEYLRLRSLSPVRGTDAEGLDKGA